MADTKLNQFVSAGSAAARAAYTPTPPTPASGPTPGYFWHETDTGDTYSWKAGTGWIKVNTGSGALADGDYGDVTVSGTGTAIAIDNDAVTFAKMQNLTTDRLLGRDTAGSGDTEQLTVGGGVEFTGSGGIQRSALTGDVTASAGSNSTTIANDAVTYAKLQNISATSRILGRKTASAGDTEECTLSEILDFIGSAAQGDILYRGAANWARLGAGTNGHFLKTQGAGADPVWAAPSGGGWALAGAGQTATGIWNQAVDGTKATADFTGLTGTEILIVCRNVTQSVSGVLALRASVNNGSSFYGTSGDYVLTPVTGVEANNDFFGAFHGTNATTARSGAIQLPAAGVSGVPKTSNCITAGVGNNRYFVASTSPIDAVRVLPSSGGNLTGGAIYVFTR